MSYFLVYIGRTLQMWYELSLRARYGGVSIFSLLFVTALISLFWVVYMNGDEE